MNPLATHDSSGRVFSVAGDRHHFLITGEESGGAFAMIEVFVQTQHGPPLHVHHREDEFLHVLEGEFTFTVAGRTQLAKSGQTLHVKKDVPHTFKNTGDKPGRLIVVFAPPGLEKFFAEVGTPLDSPQAMPVDISPSDIKRMVGAAPRYGIEVISQQS